MSSLLYFLLGIIVGMWLGFVWGKRSRPEEGKEENKKKILKLFESRSELSNSDIQEAFGFSDRSVVRYMDELEAEGKVEQIGDIGRGVVYRLKNQ
ncbi:MAG: winged helix-turn-helix domain-containing protein [Parcubacteria group bacterium]|nr:winged helix-turn-helix domain-containing protein [Parcubacteria group bacterium]